MRDAAKGVWKDPVWSKVIAVAILAGFTWISDRIWGWGAPIIGWLVALHDWLGEQNPVYNWVLVVCSLFVVVVVVVVAAALVDGRRGRSPSIIDYRANEFFGLRWQWKLGSSGAVHSLFVLCPQCKYQLNLVRNYSTYHSGSFVYECDLCGLKVELFEDPRETEEKVERRIQQKLRMGTWVEVVGKI